MKLPADYEQRVYAGVLGKLIGVYLGRPVENWSHERIEAELGEIDYYVNARADVRLNNHTLVVTDDDISGTFAFLRALPDSGAGREITAAQIGEAWLNYSIEGRTVFWWGGMGNSTEHTAWLRLKHGVAAPASGSAELNGTLVAEQIGAQIFIDGWAMLAPGDPELASELARKAGSVSHDGEAVYAAQAIAAMEAQAFVEADIDRLLDVALALIPGDCVIARMIGDIREWHACGEDWRATRRRIDERYGYHAYGGNCHVVPNHGLIVSALLHGGGDFQRSLKIVNTCGWDTDCNSGNLGCLLGIRGGLAAIEAGPDWRTPVADRMYLSTADGGEAITDAVIETFKIVNLGRSFAGLDARAPKAGARFHFELPGSLQGFAVDRSLDAGATATLENVAGHSDAGERSLAVRYRLGAGRVARVGTPTFIPPEAAAGEAINSLDAYDLLACPTLYSGQTLRAHVLADAANDAGADCALFVKVYDRDDRLVTMHGERATVAPGAAATLEWRVGDTGGCPIAEVGVELACESPREGVVYLDYLAWDGAPEIELRRVGGEGEMWSRAWVPGVDRFEAFRPSSLRVVHDDGVGLLAQGTREWSDYELSAALRTDLAVGAGIAVRVQGMRRYYALLLDAHAGARLVKARDGLSVLARADFDWDYARTYELKLRVRGTRLQAEIDGIQLFDVHDRDATLGGGGVALVCVEGCVAADSLRVRAL